ncbi:MAG: TonB family protein [Candidatus Eremiobacteraeota bacterium]|nr:TonB family protein [Candidatus Eremiobacteraeota bacterium]
MISRLRPLVVALSVVVALYAVTAPSARAATTTPCPLRVVSFMLVARGQTGAIDRFVVGLLLSGHNPVSASLSIPGLQNDILTPVVAPAGDGSESISHYVLDVPRADNATGLTVLGVLVHGPNEAEITCHQTVRVASSAPGSATASFDDSALSASDLLYMQPVAEAQVLQSEPARYSATPDMLKRAAPAVIAVIVGKGGTILSTRVEQSSGFPALDSDAVTAARAIVFSEPQFNGAAIPVEYLMTYRFDKH